jgi:hypothetical protein
MVLASNAMPIEAKLLHGLIWITIRGDVHAPDFALHSAVLARLERECDTSPNRFTDVSENTSHPDRMAMSGFADIRTRAPLKNAVKSAVFAPYDYQFEMACVFQELNKNPRIEVRVFRDKTKALEWVGYIVDAPAEQILRVPANLSQGPYTFRIGACLRHKANHARWGRLMSVAEKGYWLVKSINGKTECWAQNEIEEWEPSLDELFKLNAAHAIGTWPSRRE